MSICGVFSELVMQEIRIPECGSLFQSISYTRNSDICWAFVCIAWMDGLIRDHIGALRSVLFCFCFCSFLQYSQHDQIRKQFYAALFLDIVADFSCCIETSCLERNITILNINLIIFSVILQRSAKCINIYVKSV